LLKDRETLFIDEIRYKLLERKGVQLTMIVGKSRGKFALLVFVSAVLTVCFMRVVASENPDSKQEPKNLLWLLDDKYLKATQTKETLSPQDRQVLDDLANSKVPTTRAAE
jgi:hypothetical protein